MPACIQECGGLHVQKQGERIRNGTSASAQRRVFGRRRIEEGSVRRKSGAAVGRGIIAFQQQDFVGFHRRHTDKRCAGLQVT
jgi:hypothetical protein